MQAYTIRATPRRFGFPEAAIEYCCSTLEGAKSSVRTWDGTTEVFSVLTSVRQGDPFAPIMFAMINDVLHRGYVDGHAGSLSGVGYTFDAGPATRIASCGYADDVLVFAESAEALQRMHQWTRESFGAHAFKLNAKKTKLTGYCAPGELDGKFFTVDGTTAIEPIPPSTDFRYLGVRIALDRSWEAELQRLDRAVNHVGAIIRTHGMTCTSGVGAVNAYLIPQMDLGLRVLPVTSVLKSRLIEWRNSLQDDILIAHGAWLRRPNRDAFCEVTGTVDLPRYCRYTRWASTMQRLNTRRDVLPPTAWCRLAAFRPRSSMSEVLRAVSARKRTSGRNRVVDALVTANSFK